MSEILLDRDTMDPRATLDGFLANALRQCIDGVPAEGQTTYQVPDGYVVSLHHRAPLTMIATRINGMGEEVAGPLARFNVAHPLQAVSLDVGILEDGRVGVVACTEEISGFRQVFTIGAAQLDYYVLGLQEQPARV